MVRVHKRKKNSRIRGSRTAGWGFRQSHKGHGNKGGVGLAGTGKRADHKKQVALEGDKKKRYFGKQGGTSRGTKKRKELMINLYDIKDNMFKKEGEEIDLSKYKILGSGEGFKANIVARAATKLAAEKMAKAGGSITVVIAKVGIGKEGEAAEKEIDYNENEEELTSDLESTK